MLTEQSTMILFFTVALLPVLLAQKDLPCDSCCPPPSAPDGDAVSCSNLSDKIQMLQNAINLSSCGKDSGSSSADDAGVCMTVTMQAIPPCMLKEGSTAQSQCLIEAAKAISKELPGADEASGLEIVKKCKCDAFRKMWKNLVNVKEMICVDDYARSGKNYQQQPGHGGQVAHYPAPQYGANTLWFQYAMCQGQDFSCFFFTNNWNQGDFGQYYLYENLLGDGNLLGGDNSLLPILALTGGHGGGMGGLLPLALLGGFGGDRKRRDAAAVEECVPGDEGCPTERRRRGAAVTCAPGDMGCPTERRRREAAVTCVLGDEGCPTERRRRGAAVTCVPGDEGCPTERRRREAAVTCAPGDEGCPTERRRREAEEPCSSYNDCDYGYACEGANANKRGVCRVI